MIQKKIDIYFFITLLFFFREVNSQKFISTESDDKENPIEIYAEDGIEWHKNIQKYIAKGNANAKKADLLIKSDYMEAKYEDSDITLDLHPEWMIRTGRFGNTDTRENIQIRLKTSIELLFKEKYTKVLDKKNLLVNPENKVLVNIQLNDELSRKLFELVENKFKQARLDLAYSNMGLVQTKPNSLVAEKTKYLTQLKSFCQERMTRKIQVLNLKTQTTTAILASNNPKSILQRGYSITYSSNHKVIKDVSSLRIGSEILTVLSSGSVCSKVEKVSE